MHLPRPKLHLALTCFGSCTWAMYGHVMLQFPREVHLFACHISWWPIYLSADNFKSCTRMGLLLFVPHLLCLDFGVLGPAFSAQEAAKGAVSERRWLTCLGRARRAGALVFTKHPQGLRRREVSLDGPFGASTQGLPTSLNMHVAFDFGSLAGAASPLCRLDFLPLRVDFAAD